MAANGDRAVEAAVGHTTTSPEPGLRVERANDPFQGAAMSQRSGRAEGAPCDRLLELHQRRPSGCQRGLDDLLDRILAGRLVPINIDQEACNHSISIVIMESWRQA